MIDGYQLYDLIKDGKPHSVAVGETTFQFQFKGQKVKQLVRSDSSQRRHEEVGLGLELRSLLALPARP
jgi:hypothetical protein